MKNEIEKDLPALSAIFILLIVLGLYFKSEYSNYKNQELMSKAITIIQKQDVRIEMLEQTRDSLNSEIDYLENRIGQMTYLDTLLKDLHRDWTGK